MTFFLTLIPSKNKDKMMYLKLFFVYISNFVHFFQAIND